MGIFSLVRNKRIFEKEAEKFVHEYCSHYPQNKRDVIDLYSEAIDGSPDSAAAAKSKLRRMIDNPCFSIKAAAGAAQNSILPKSEKELEIREKRDFAAKFLDQQVIGHAAAKARCLQIYTKFLQENHQKSFVIALAGPYGNGKSTLAIAMAKILGRPWRVQDMTSLVGPTGDKAVYLGSQPGFMATNIESAGCKDLVIIGEEIDKNPDDEKRVALHNYLAHLLDPTRNHQAVDDYFALPIDCSEVGFIFTMNDVSAITNVLWDRIKDNTIHTQILNDAENLAVMNSRIAKGPYAYSEEAKQDILRRSNKRTRGIVSLMGRVEDYVRDHNIMLSQKKYRIHEIESCHVAQTLDGWQISMRECPYPLSPDELPVYQYEYPLSFLSQLGEFVHMGMKLDITFPPLGEDWSYIKNCNFVFETSFGDKTPIKNGSIFWNISLRDAGLDIKLKETYHGDGYSSPIDSLAQAAFFRIDQQGHRSWLWGFPLASKEEPTLLKIDRPLKEILFDSTETVNGNVLSEGDTLGLQIRFQFFRQFTESERAMMSPRPTEHVALDVAPPPQVQPEISGNHNTQSYTTGLMRWCRAFVLGGAVLTPILLSVGLLTGPVAWVVVASLAGAALVLWCMNRYQTSAHRPTPIEQQEDC